MKKIFSLFILLVILILCTFVVQSAESVITDTIYNGMPKEYDINGVHYKVEIVLLVGYESRAVYSINDEIKRLNLHEVVSLNENTDFRLDEIIELSYQERTVISFISKTNCVNNVCDSGETCSSCAQDCGCKSGYKCQSNQCIEEFACGDNICDSNENCGTCTNDCTCSKSEICKNNKCMTYCGNEICESDEKEVCKYDCVWCGDGECNNNEDHSTCQKDCEKPVICGDGVCYANENCCEDCGCETGFQCKNNSCVSIYECMSNIDCSSNKTCVENKCILVSKVPQENKSSTQNLIQSYAKNNSNKSSDKSIVLKEEVAKELAEKKGGFIKVVISWLFSWFK